MRNVLTVAGREMRSYFVSPLAYVIAAIFLAITGYFFYVILFYSQEATMRYLFGNMTVILMLLIPALTMRLLAEEQSKGTMELLLTSPVRDWEVVVGKYLAAVVLLAVILALTSYYPLVLNVYGNPDMGPILGGYLGILLLGASLLALGLFASSVTSNQIIAAVLALALVLAFWLIDALSGMVSGSLSDFFTYLSLSAHFQDFARGIIDTKDVIFMLSVIAGGLFVTTRVVEARRWR